MYNYNEFWTCNLSEVLPELKLSLCKWYAAFSYVCTHMHKHTHIYIWTADKDLFLGMPLSEQTCLCDGRFPVSANIPQMNECTKDKRSDCNLKANIYHKPNAKICLKLCTLNESFFFFFQFWFPFSLSDSTQTHHYENFTRHRVRPSDSHFIICIFVLLPIWLFTYLFELLLKTFQAMIYLNHVYFKNFYRFCETVNVGS